jgi:hypothetical protein
VKKIAAFGCVALIALGVAVSWAEDQEKGMEMPKPTKEHAWVEQLVGEWEYEGEANMGPDQPPMKMKGTEHNRSLGGFWALCEHKADFMGAPFTGILTLGYDPEKKHYVASWVDSMSSHLWTYTGKIEGKVLTLETEGPAMDQPGKTCKFRESIEVKDKDTKTFTSKREMDGKWVTIMTMTSKRKK